MAPHDRAIFLISIAAEMAGMHPQTLREYDRLGIVSPSRTAGRGRRYSQRDVELLREVQRLSQEEGVNLAGIKRILELQRRVGRLEEENRRLRLIAEPGHHRVFAASGSGDVIVTTRNRVRLAPRDNSTALVRWSPQN